MILAKIIHVSLNRIEHLLWNVEKNVKREGYVQSEVFPLLSKNGFEPSFFDATMIPDFEYNRGGSERLVKNYDKYIKYQNNLIKVGLNNDDPPRSYEIALFLSHYNLWKMSVEKNIPILIMEDDVLFDDASAKYISEMCVNFVTKTNKLLYLQSVSPSRPTHNKAYDFSNLKQEDSFYIVSKNHGDFSGTCCYMVTPSSSKILLDFVNNFGAICIDGFIHNCHRYTNLDICIPQKYNDCAKLHLEYC